MGGKKTRNVSINVSLNKINKEKNIIFQSFTFEMSDQESTKEKKANVSINVSSN